MAPVSKRWVLARRARSGPLDPEENFELKEEHTPELRRDEILCRALFFSVDPITRLHLSFGLQEGEVIPGRQVARVVESKNQLYPKGKLIVGTLGWQTYSVVNPSAGDDDDSSMPVVYPLPSQVELSGLPKSASLGVLGVNGIMAYLGLLHTCRAREGETLVLSSAAGATGHIAGQIAKYMGLKVIGYTGDSEKASWIKTQLGFDWAFNYKTQDVSQTLRIAAPDGVDVFLDGVGGALHQAVLQRMRQGGRVCLFGNLSYYDQDPKAAAAAAAAARPMDMDVAIKGLSIVGFNPAQFPSSRREEALQQLAEWCRDGYVDAAEEQEEGFENLPRALEDTLRGKYQGKVVLRI